MSEEFVQNPLHVERGTRLRRIREMARLTKDALANMAGLTRQSVSSWETAKNNGLSRNGADLIITALINHGVYCDFNWLWSGKGEEPYLLTEGIKEPTVTAALANHGYPQDLCPEEMKLFEQSYQHAVIMEIKHNGMSPIYQEGDWVGGCWRAISPRLLHQVCIVEIDGYVEVRLVKGRSAEGYDLRFMTYPAETMEPFELINQNPARVAPVIRMWRK